MDATQKRLHKISKTEKGCLAAACATEAERSGASAIAKILNNSKILNILNIAKILNNSKFKCIRWYTASMLVET